MHTYQYQNQHHLKNPTPSYLLHVNSISKFVRSMGEAPYIIVITSSTVKQENENIVLSFDSIAFHSFKITHHYCIPR